MSNSLQITQIWQIFTVIPWKSYYDFFIFVFSVSSGFVLAILDCKWHSSLHLHFAHLFLTQINLTLITYCDSNSPSLWTFLFLLMSVFALQCVFPLFEKLYSCCCLGFHFHQTQKEIPLFTAQLMTIFMLWDQNNRFSMPDKTPYTIK